MKNSIGYHEEDGYDGGTRITIYRTDVPNDATELAKQFVERWGMVAGIPDGEDSAGRAKVRLATPEEMVTRAIETAELFIEATERKGWYIAIPAPKPSKRRSREEAKV